MAAGDPALPTGLETPAGAGAALPWVVVGVAAAGVLALWALRRAAFALQETSPAPARRRRRR